MSARVIQGDLFESLIPMLISSGYRVVAPTLDEGAIVYDVIDDAADLPIGWTDEQGPASYRSYDRGDDVYFGYSVGPRSLRAFLSPPHLTLLTITRGDTDLAFASDEHEGRAYAFVGVRACDLAALAIQDKVLVESRFVDAAYTSARSRSLVIAVNCSVAGATCFCASMGTGPRCSSGYDLVVTELVRGDAHEFVVESGTDAGADILGALGSREASPSDITDAADVSLATERAISTSMPDVDTYTLLTDNLEHSIWEDIAQRCLSCTNCTLVCPTCFCSTISDFTDLAGKATRTKSWDSCFSLDFSNLHGHPVRTSSSSRYRQWITHKLAYWYDQFGSSGCVGCGRCITWCPVGIDITEEIQRLDSEAQEVPV
ncbi:MAG: 4Fe-4S dicluster domain-containing protein [Actinomycetia bacterium]|nr:4Fe-4S dicluster domain-containing protein [Actinomycetes bacterium]